LAEGRRSVYLDLESPSDLAKLREPEFNPLHPVPVGGEEPAASGKQIPSSSTPARAGLPPRQGLRAAI
jgi:hypothetical protein